MGKMKNKKSQSPKPSPVIQHDAFISKNKKRKEKRNSQKLNIKQADTGDFIPVKKNALKPLQLSGLSKKPQLSTSLPIKGKKQGKRENANNSIATFNAFPSAEKGKKVTGILSNPNTPKRNKHEHVTFDDSVKKNEEPINVKVENVSGKKSLKNKSLLKSNVFGKMNMKKFLDNEADEGEEPINDKVVKPYEKKSLKRKQMTESSDESEDDDDGSVDAEDFLDFEASEGEETDDDEDDSDADGDDSDDSDGNESKYLSSSSFIDDDDESEEDDSDEDDESENDEESEDDDDDEPTLKKKEVITPSKAKEKPVNQQPSAKISTKTTGISKISVPPQKTNLPTTPKGKAISLEPPANVTSLTPSKVKGKTTNLEAPGKEKIPTSSVAQGVIAESKTPAKNEVQSEKKKKDQKKKNNKSEDMNVDQEVTVTEKTSEKPERPSNFIGFIRKLPTTVTEKEITSAVSRVLDKDELVKVMFAKNRRDGSQNAFIYVKDGKSLGNLIHEKFDISGSLCPVYRARSSAAEESPPSPPEPVAFLPRVPQWITEEELKIAVEKEIGAGKVTELKERRFIKSLQTRNILMSFVDTDALKKAIVKGDFKIKDHTVIVREAVEGVQVPVYRAVFSNIPEGMDEAALKKTIESTIGKNTVENIRFSFRKNSFVFVVFKDEETMKKALALGDNISVKGTKLKVQPYTPRKPHKRAPPNEHAKAKQAEKKKRKPKTAKDGQQKSASGKPNPKKQKLENGSANVPKKQKKSEQQESNTKKTKLENVSSNIPATPNSPNKQKNSNTPNLPNKQKKGKKQPGLNKKKQDNNSPSTPNTPNSPSTPNTPNSPNKQKKKNKQKKPSIASPTGEVKATKNPKIKQKQKRKQSFSASPPKDNKISPLKEKIQAKQNKLKGEKKQQQKKKMKLKKSI